MEAGVSTPLFSLSPRTSRRFGSTPSLAKVLKEALRQMACTNEQLAEVARRLPRSQGALREVPGISEARVEKFGALLLEVTAK